MIWAEADKLGFFINTVTEPVLAKEKQVVKNEKRQAVDNVPYGHVGAVIAENLYPAGHPYSWEVIGSLADLDAAKLEDVRKFYRQWYVPGNVSLVIAGDFDPAQARKWVEKYFGEIPAGGKVDPAPVRAASLGNSKSLYHEDNFAELPQLTMVWPTVPALHPDSAPLNALADLLTDGKKAPLNAVLIDEKKLTSEVSAGQNEGKIAGEMWLQVRAFDGKDLDAVKGALDEGFARFERQGVDPAALERVKTQQEVAVYDGIGSVLGKVSRPRPLRSLCRRSRLCGSGDRRDPRRHARRRDAGLQPLLQEQALCRGELRAQGQGGPRLAGLRPRQGGRRGHRPGRRNRRRCERRRRISAHGVQLRSHRRAALRRPSGGGAPRNLAGAASERPQGARHRRQ
jgi:hypothetical protein